MLHTLAQFCSSSPIFFFFFFLNIHYETCGSIPLNKLRGNSKRELKKKLNSQIFTDMVSILFKAVIKVVEKFKKSDVIEVISISTGI